MRAGQNSERATDARVYLYSYQLRSTPRGQWYLSFAASARANLVQSTQNALAEYMEAHYLGVIPRGVEGAPFVVLHRTTMPSVLVEAAFISNPQAEARLRTTRYQRALAKGML